MKQSDLVKFCRESNAIEGITSEKRLQEHVLALGDFLTLETVTVADLVNFVKAIEPGARLRDRVGMNVRIGDYRPPGGQPGMAYMLEGILSATNLAPKSTPPIVIDKTHRDYEQLHPFTDGNGRSGRALWLWMMEKAGERVYDGSFLRTWYYQSLR